jgi:ATP-dependent protease ClpP protease subunit
LNEYRIEGEIVEGLAAEVAAFLRTAKGEVTVIVNSPGGSAFEGLAIMDELSRHGRVTARVVGLAASAASVAIMGARRIVMTQQAFLMIHESSGTATGTARALARSGEAIDKVDARIAAAYAKRSGLPEAEIRELMAAETWLTAAEAVEKGFADEIAGADVPAEPVARFDPAAFRNVPRRLLAMAAAMGWAARPSDWKGQEMNQIVTPPLAAAERARARKIVHAAGVAGLDPALTAELVDSPLSAVEAVDRISDAWAARVGSDAPMHGAPRARIGFSWDSPEASRAKAVDALQGMIDPRHRPTIGASLGRDVEALAIGRARAMGGTATTFAESIRAAAHSTSDFPLITEAAMAAVMGRQIEAAPLAIMAAAREIEAMDYRPSKMITLSSGRAPGAAATAMQEIAEGGEVRAATIDEAGEAKPVPRDFGAIFKATNKLLVNGERFATFLQECTAEMTQSCTGLMRDVLLAPVLANSGAGQAMSNARNVFNTTDGTLAGTAAAITVSSLAAGLQAMRLQKDAAGALLAVEPRFLLVGPAKEVEARRLVAEMSAVSVNEVNPFAGRLEVLVEPGLGSGNAWYLLGDPARFDGLAYSYLAGQRGPTVETRMGWESLGMEIRVTMPFDAKFVARSAWWRNAGA